MTRPSSYAALQGGRDDRLQVAAGRRLGKHRRPLPRQRLSLDTRRVAGREHTAWVGAQGLPERLDGLVPCAVTQALVGQQQVGRLRL